MAIELPAPVAGYFAADAGPDAQAVADKFTDGAIVRDEGETYRGRAAIRTWKAASSAQYSYAVTPFDIAVDGDSLVVTAHVTGDFPGSPVDLRYGFVLDGERIAELDIGAI